MKLTYAYAKQLKACSPIIDADARAAARTRQVLPGHGIKLVDGASL